MVGRVSVVVGAQFGSEAKGAVAAWLSTRYPTESVVGVRVGGPNAGHTVYGNCPVDCDLIKAHDGGSHPWRLRQVPVLAVSRPGARLVIAAGSEIDPQVLFAEIESLVSAGYRVSDLLEIDESATVIYPQHLSLEAMHGINQSIGSTAKGIGAARADRIWRRARTMADIADDMSFPVADTSASLARYLDAGRHVIVEGTQGYGLGLHTEYYPYTTSGDCRAVDFLAQAGISPWQTGIERLDVWVVARTRPIRVAGNSGPLDGETTWEDLDLPEERTTVTNRVRRVGEWDPELVNKAIRANGGPASNVRVALTMVDYDYKEVAGHTDWLTLSENQRRGLRSCVDRYASSIIAPISLIGTGPQSMMVQPVVFPPDDEGLVNATKWHEYEIGVLPASTRHAENELTEWWLEQARQEAALMAPKVAEYGGKGAAIDLIEIGRDLARMADPDSWELYSTAHVTEMGIYFYLRGKFSRWTAALLEGRRVSDDTLHDISVYCRMAQRTRSVGGWPYAPEIKKLTNTLGE